MYNNVLKLYSVSRENSHSRILLNLERLRRAAVCFRINWVRDVVHDVSAVVFQTLRSVGPNARTLGRGMAPTVGACRY